MSLFTNNLWSSFPCQLGSWSLWATLKQHPLEYLTSNFYYEKVPLFFPGQVNMRTGVEMVTSPKRIGGQFKLLSGQKQGEQAQGARLWVPVELPTITFYLGRRSSNMYCVLYYFATLFFNASS